MLLYGLNSLPYRVKILRRSQIVELDILPLFLTVQLLRDTRTETGHQGPGREATFIDASIGSADSYPEAEPRSGQDSELHTLRFLG